MGSNPVDISEALGMDTRFHCVYLLTSLDPSCEGEYYIGYTVHPLRRLRQHNGELVNGARRTRRRGRPWALVCCVSGFSEDRVALKFEWCWQHPLESSRLRQAAQRLTGLHKLPYAVALLHILVHAELFRDLELTLHVFEGDLFRRMSVLARGHVPRAAWRKDSPDSAPRSCDGDREWSPIPALTEGPLFRIKESSCESFEREYLAHDRGLGEDALGGGGLAMPFDATSLSETVLHEWGCHTPEGSLTTPVRSDAQALGAVEEGDALHDDSRLRRVPLRFTRYHARDYASAYARESAQLRRGLLACSLCALPLRSPYVMRCPRSPFCALRTHILCLSLWAHHDAAQALNEASTEAPPERENPEEKEKEKEEEEEKEEKEGDEEADLDRGSAASPASPEPSVTLVPSRPFFCPLCGEELRWVSLVRELKQRAVLEARLAARQRRDEMEEAWRSRLISMGSQHKRLHSKKGRSVCTLRQERRLRLRGEKASPRRSSPGSREGEAGGVPAAPLPPPEGSLEMSTLILGAGSDGGSPGTFRCASGGVMATESTSLLPWTEFNEEEWFSL